jgi:glyoxylase-like metal-dependent hydrolase (beta-lactamase superfamily II)
VIDPGPKLQDHIDALLQALDGETVTHILITHTHNDHSPAAAAIKAATGAKTYGFGPHGHAIHNKDGRPEERIGGVTEEGGDRDFVPDVPLREGNTIEGGGEGPTWHIAAVETPGHTSNHLCFSLAEERTLFTGDHVMGWSTSVISPPDGDMGAYMRSLNKLLYRDDAVYWPTHGPSIPEPKPFVNAFIAHRHERSSAIMRALAAGDETIPAIVARVYVGLDPKLTAAAGRSTYAQLVELIETGKVICDGPLALASHYRLA